MDDVTPPRPLSLDLLGPLMDRPQVLMSNVEVREDPNPRYIAALRTLLATDLRSGALTQDDLTRVLMQVVDKMGSVRQAEGSTAPWAAHGTAWIEHAGADPRVALVAWLMHQGANPWGSGSAPDAAHAGTVELMLTYGYLNAVEHSLDMSEASLHDLTRPCPNRWDYNRQQLDIMQMAAHVGATGVIDRLAALGVDLGDALWYARAPDAVHALIKHNATSTGAAGPSNAELAPHWSNVLPANIVRPMIAALATTVSPADAVLLAARSSTWAPLRDALAACPEWKDIKTPMVSGLEARLPLAMLLGSCSRGSESRRAQSLRLVDRSPPDDREIAPGLTEASLVRLSLVHIIKKTHPSRQSGVKLVKQAGAILTRLCAPDAIEQVLLRDGQAFSRALSTQPLLIKHAAIASMVLDYRLATPMEFKQAGGLSADHQDVTASAKLLPHRTVDDALSIARILHAFVLDTSLESIGRFTRVFGVEAPSVSRSIYPSAADNHGRWLDAMFKDNPDRQSDVAYVGTVFTSYLIAHRVLRNTVSSSSINLDFWVSRVQGWMDRGVDPGIDQQFSAAIAQRADSHPNLAARNFAQSLSARVCRLQMEKSVESKSSATSSAPRF